MSVTRKLIAPALALMGIGAALFLPPSVRGSQPPTAWSNLPHGDRTPALQVPAPPTPLVGVVVASESAEVVAPTAGKIVAIHVGLGDRVEKGDLIATLDARLTRADLAAAQAGTAAQEVEQRMAEAARDAALEREQRVHLLAGKGLVPGEELRAAVEESTQARLRVSASQSLVARSDAQARRLLDEKRLMEVRAPFAGRVVARYLDPGAAASLVPPRPIVRLISDQRLLLRLAIPADQVGTLVVGSAVQAVAESGAGAVRGTIRRLAPQVDPASNTVMAEASIEHSSGPVVAGLVVEVLALAAAPLGP